MQPKYVEVKKQIEKIIEDLDANNPIESERVLSDKLGVSRMTVRKAIDHLVIDGKLYRDKNKGTFVSDKKLHKVVNYLSGFTSEVKKSGGNPSNKVVKLETIIANEFIADKLGINEGDEVYHLLRIRFNNDIPLLLDESYFPCDLIKGLTEEIATHSIYKYIENELGHTISSSIQNFDAVFIPSEYAEYLSVSENEPIIQVELTAHLKDGTVFEYSKSYKNSKKYKLTIQSMKY